MNSRRGCDSSIIDVIAEVLKSFPGADACRFILSKVRNIDVKIVARDARSLFSRATVSCGSVNPVLKNYAIYYRSLPQLSLQRRRSVTSGFA